LIRTIEVTLMRESIALPAVGTVNPRKEIKRGDRLRQGNRVNSSVTSE